MNTNQGKLSFGIGLDTSELNKDIAKSESAFESLADSAVNEGARIDSMFQGLGKTAAKLGLAWSMQSLAKQIVTVRGEFQQLEVAMETMLGSASKGKELMAQMVETASTTPFGLQEVASGAKQLLAYGVAAEDVNDTLIRLGDIAAGLSMPLNDLVYLYGTTMAQGRLYTQDLNQFTGRGIPMIQELAKQFGVAENEVKSLVEAGKVGFPEVKKVIESLTNEGGKFGGLMEKQSHTISGQISNIEDQFDIMFNEIGSSSEGFINDALEGVSWLVDHYKEVGNVLMTLVATYGVYKTTLMATTAFTNAAYNYEISQLKILTGEHVAEVDADLASAVSKGRMTAARAREVQALRLELAAKIENAKATAIEAANEQRSATVKRMQAQLAYQKARAEVEAKQEEIAACESMYAHQTAETLQKEKDVLVTKMHAAQEKLDAAAAVEHAATTKANTAAQTVNTLTTQRDTLAKKLNVTQTKLLTVMSQGLVKALQAVKSAFMSNPLGMILMALTMVAGAFMSFSSGCESAMEQSNKFGEAAAKVSRDVDMLLLTINSTSRDSKVHASAIDELSKIYEEYGIKIDEEKDKLEQLNAMREKAIELIRKEGAERAKANILDSYNQALSQATDKMRETLKEQFAEAEWDGSGYLDDYDANEVNKHADELATVIGAIYESAAIELTDLDPVSEEYLDKLEDVKKRVSEAYVKITGEAADFTDGKGHLLEVEFDEILSDYIANSQNLLSAQKELADGFKKEAEEAAKVPQEVNYATLSFDELFDMATETEKVTEDIKDDILHINQEKIEPEVPDGVIAQIDLLNTKLGETLQLLGLSPTIDLRHPMSYLLQGGEYIGGLLNNILGGEEDEPPVQEKKAAAQDELNKRLEKALKTRRGTAKMLKEVNDKLEDAKTGSAEEKGLLSLQKRLTAQQKKFQEMSGKGGEAAAARLSRIEKAEAEETKLITDSAEERGRAIEDLEFKQRQNEIALEMDSRQKRRKQKQLDDEKDLADLKRQQDSAIKAEIERQRKLFDATEKIKQERDKTYVVKQFTDTDIDQSQIDEIERIYAELFKQLHDVQRQGWNDLFNEEISSMQEYLSQYGSLFQKEYAIRRKYANEIEKSRGDSARIATLERQRDDEIALAKAAEWKSQIDATALFEQMGVLLSSPLNETIKALRNYVNSDDFKKLSFEDQKTLLDALNRYQQASTGIGSFSVGNVIDNLLLYDEALRKQDIAIQEQNHATEEYAAAEQRLNEARKSGNQAAIKEAEIQLELAQARLFAANKSADQAKSDTVGASSRATNALNGFNDTIENTRNILSSLSSKSLSNVWKSMNKKMQQSITLFLTGGNKLLSSLDRLGESLDKNGITVDSFEGKLKNAVNTIAASFTDETTVEEAKNAVSTMVSEIFKETFGEDDNFEEVQKSIGNIFGGIISNNEESGEKLSNGLDQAVDGLLKKLGTAGESSGNLYGMIIGLILDLIDEFKENGIGSLAGDLIEDILGAVGGIVRNIISGQLFTDVFSGLLDGLSEWFKQITFGGVDLNDWLGMDGNAKEVMKTIDRLTDRNEHLQTAIEDLTDEIGNSKGSKSIAAYNDAYKMQKETNQNLLDIAKAQASYHNSHHSWNSYWNGFTDDEIAKFSQQIDREWDGNIWSLTPEEMKLLRGNIEMWEKIRNTGKGGYGSRLIEKLDDYIEQAGKLEELTDKLYTGLTGISFDSMYDSFIDTLMDMDSSTRDFSDKMSEYFMRAMLSNQIGEMYSDKLKGWWEKFAQAMESDGELTEDERNALTEEYMGYVNDAMELRNQLAAVTGYDKASSQQGGDKKGFATASQDSVDELNGRFTAIQMDTNNIRELLDSTMPAISVATSQIRQDTDELRNISLIAIDHLESIAKNTRELYGINNRLANIEKYTSRI